MKSTKPVVNGMRSFLTFNSLSPSLLSNGYRGLFHRV